MKTKTREGPSRKNLASLVDSFFTGGIDEGMKAGWGYKKIADAAENARKRLEQMGESGEEALDDIFSKARLAKKSA